MEVGVILDRGDRDHPDDRDDRDAVFRLKPAGGPLTSARAMAVATSSCVLAQLQDQKTLDIVIYEEDHLTRALLKEWLSQGGYRVRFGRPHDANLDRPADLLIVSVYMPKQAGAQRLRAIQASHPHTPIIAMSGQFRPGLCPDGATAAALGVRQVIAKPFTCADLLDAVRGIIATTD